MIGRSVVVLHDKQEIEPLLRRNAALHIYELGDLDDFHWPYTVWYALRVGDVPTALLLLYVGATTPVLLALSEPEELPLLRELLADSIRLLPNRLYTHLTRGAEAALTDHYVLQSKGLYHKMVLQNRERLLALDTECAVRLSKQDAPELWTLYGLSYPENSFDERMLKTEMYFGVRANGRLVSVAGVHVYSERYRVAALGNIATHPGYRGRGHGTMVTARLCNELLSTIDVIGLNVGGENTAAIRCYERLGSVLPADYHEVGATSR
jgi:ribosomal protein S18 acetylase RimI-like enzyme